ncbi:tautomerase family protein [Nocardioidaceae bacterium]|nr:tautomerase family protein [Nocardioidaceae bacterium]
MPLVRIDMQKGRSPEQVREIADVVQQVMEDVFAAPPGDRYQVVTQHEVGEIIFGDTGLGLDRTDEVMLIQVFQQGRDTSQKESLYATLADRLGKVGVRPEDLVVSVNANEQADWSFGMGRAQFLTGEL